MWINDVDEVSLWMAVCWLVAVPGQMFYLFNCTRQVAKLYKKCRLFIFFSAIFGSIIYVAIGSKVIRVQQKALIENQTDAFFCNSRKFNKYRKKEIKQHLQQYIYHLLNV